MGPGNTPVAVDNSWGPARILEHTATAPAGHSSHG